MTFRQARWDEPLLWDRESSDDDPDPVGVIPGLPASLRRKSPLEWPELSELEVIRHFTRLS